MSEIWDKIIHFNEEYVENWKNISPSSIAELIQAKKLRIDEMLSQIARGETVSKPDFIWEGVLIIIYTVSLLGRINVSYEEFKAVFEERLFNITGQLEKAQKKQVDPLFNPLDYYNMRFSLGYVGDHPDHLSLAKWFLERFNPKSLLDIGCAKGFMLKNLEVLSLETLCVGLDISDVAVKQKVFGGEGVVGCGWKLPFKDKSFDVLWSGGVLEHFPTEHVDEAIAEFSRVGKRNVHYIAMNNGVEDVTSENREHTTIAKRKWWINKVGNNRNWLIGAFEDRDPSDLGFDFKLEDKLRRTWTRVNWEGNEFDKYWRNE